MRPVLRAEYRKLRSTRGPLILMVGATVVALLGAVMTIGSLEASGLEVPLTEMNLYTLAAVNTAVFAAVGGIRMFTDDWRYGSIMTTVVLHPVRRRVLVAKMLVAALFGFVLATVALGVMLAIAAGLISARGADVAWVATDAVALAGLLAGCAAWAVIGVGLGAAIRHQVAAIVAGIVWILVVENLGAAFLGDAGHWLPAHAGYALAQAAGFGDGALGPGAGGVVLVFYAGLIALVGTAFFRQRDVSPG